VPDAETGSLTDLALLERSAAGDREAFDAIVARHGPSVYRLARLLAPRQDEADDVFQQAFLAAWKGASQFRGEASARTWLMAIARNAAIGLRRRHLRERVTDTPLDELGVRAGWGGPDPEALAVAAEHRERLAAAFAALAPEDREVITLRDLEGLSGEEAAALLGIGVAAMKSRLHRARMTLAAQVRKEVPRAAGRT
jgi:RNA polymerase sigma-70 factor, ECF subfamily